MQIEWDYRKVQNGAIEKNKDQMSVNVPGISREKMLLSQLIFFSLEQNVNNNKDRVALLCQVISEC
jgi:hypothetical protein